MARYVQASVVVVALALFLAVGNSSVAAASEVVHPVSAQNSWPGIHGSGGNVGNAAPAFPTLRYARVLVYATLHTVGEGAGQGSEKSPLTLDIKVFDKKRVGLPSPEDYPALWNSTFGLTTSTILWYSSIVDYGGGQATLYPVWVPAKDPFYQENSGSYVIVGKAGVDGADVYVGFSTDVLVPGAVIEQYVQIIRNSKGKLTPAD